MAVGRNVRGLPHDVGDREAVLLRDRHVDARHQREMIGHVALVAVAEIGGDVFRPLIGFGQQQLAGRMGVELGADALDHRVGLGQVLVAGALALAQIRDGIEPEAVDAEIEPVAHHLDDGGEHVGVVEIEIRLVREEPVPVIGLRHRVPGPVRFLGVVEDDAGAGVTLVGVAPHIPVARVRARPAGARALEPGMLVGGVVDHQLDDDAQLAALGLLHEAAEILHGAEVGIDVAVVGDVVAVVAAGRGKERQQPKRGDAEILQIVELLGQPDEIADAVAVAVGERLDVQLVDDGILEPELVRIERVFDLDLRGGVHDFPFHARHRNRRAGSCSGSMRSRTPPHSTVMRSPVTEILDGRDAAARARGADLDLAEMEPELARPGPAQRDRYRHRIVAGGRFLDEADDLGVVEAGEAQVVGLLQRRVGLAHPVELPDVVLDVAGLVPVAHLDLVLLGIQIFLLAGQRLVLEELEAVVDAVIAGTAWRRARRAP